MSGVYVEHYSFVLWIWGGVWHAECEVEAFSVVFCVACCVVEGEGCGVAPFWRGYCAVDVWGCSVKCVDCVSEIVCVCVCRDECEEEDC